MYINQETLRRLISTFLKEEYDRVCAGRGEEIKSNHRICETGTNAREWYFSSPRVFETRFFAHFFIIQGRVYLKEEMKF